MAYQDILENLVESLSEIQGAFIFNDQQGVLDSQDRVTTNVLQKKAIGEAFSKTFFMMSIHYRDISIIRFNYREMILFGGKFNEQDYLIVICGAQTSSGMTRISIQMALNTLKETLEPSLQTAAPIETAPIVTPDTLLQPNSALSKPLNQIRDLLAQQVGPVADVLFEDALNDWIDQTTPSFEKLNKLVQLLRTEIGEDSVGNEFSTEASKLF